MTRTLTISLTFVVAAFAASAVLYPQLPALMPVHFDAYDRPNGWMTKPWGATFAPLMMVFLTVVMTLSRARIVSQRGEDAARGFDIISLATLAFAFEVHVVLLLHDAGYAVGISRAVFAGVGLLFTIIGNSFGKLRPNGVVGIRTPRTLANDETWLMTHRFGGRVFVLGGLVVFVAALAGASTLVLLFAYGAVVLLPIVYSYTFGPKGSP